MINKRILVVIFLLATVLVCIFPFVQRRRALSNIPVQVENIPIVEQPSEPREFTREEAKGTINASDIKTLVGYLCSYNGRLSGSQDNIDVSHFIQDQLKNFGINEQLDGFRLGNQQTQNVYGWIDGIKSSSCLVVGAHFDGQGPGKPGADDNASGTAGVIMLARAFSVLKSSVPKTLVFQLYSAEEMGCYGSRFYVKYPKFPRDNPSIKSHFLMINLDMIGHLGNKSPKSVFNFGASAGTSDQINFYNAGVPSYFVFTGMHRNYHTPADTVESLDYEGMEKLLKYVYDVVWYNLEKEQNVDFSIPLEPIEATLDHDSSPFLRVYE